MDDERQRHDRSVYERPSLPFHCGRGSTWQKPCWQGPSLKGQCRGVAACRPVRKGDRFECRRPSHAGGPCKEAPLPDGTCAHVSPPCVPRPTLRTLRGRLSWLSVIVTLAVIALSANFIELSIARVKPGASIDPGPLSRAHTGFARERGCVSCHASHGKSPLEWLADTTRPAGLSDGCTDCHSFDGPALAAHNTRFTHRSDLPELTCESCHTEHKGTDYDPSTVSDVTCVNCHQSQVSAFGRNHAEFPHNYPSDVPNSIRFDHNKHLKEYFQQAQWLDKPGRDKAFALQARIRCTACHLVESATREVKPAAFEQICAGCHSGQLEQRPLTVFMAGSTVPMSNFLLGLDEETEEEEIIEERHAEFLSAMAETQLDAFVEALAEQQSEERAPALFEALGAALVRNAASAWRCFLRRIFRAPQNVAIVTSKFTRSGAVPATPTRRFPRCSTSSNKRSTTWLRRSAISASVAT